MKIIKKEFLLPWAIYTVPRSQIKYYKDLDENPEVGDLVYGEIISIGEHPILKNDRLPKCTQKSKISGVLKIQRIFMKSE